MLNMYGVISSGFKVNVLSSGVSCDCSSQLADRPLMHVMHTSHHQTAVTTLYFKQLLFESGSLFILDGIKLA